MSQTASWTPFCTYDKAAKPNLMAQIFSVQTWQLDLGSKLAFTDGDLVGIMATKSGNGANVEIDFARWSLPDDEARFFELSNAVIQRAQKLLEVVRVG